MDDMNENRDGAQAGNAGQGSGNDKPGLEDARAAMMKEIDSLKEQVTSLTSKLSDGASQAKEAASGWVDSAAEQARDVSQVAKAYPGAMSSASLLGLAIGVLVGFAVSHASQPSRHWYDRHWR